MARTGYLNYIASMIILDGKKVSVVFREKIKREVDVFNQKTKKHPGLAVILVGEDPASQVYVKNKSIACSEVGILSTEYKLDKNIDKNELKKIILNLNSDKNIHGILVQLPLPKHLNSDEVLSWIDPKKDPDALTSENMGLSWKGIPRVQPCTPAGVIEILKFYGIELSGKSAVVVGRSHIVGKPMANLLLDEQCTVTICHSKTKNLKQYTQEADVVVVAAGKPQFLGKDDFKKGSVIIDVGIHRIIKNDKTELCGDVRFSELMDWAYAATPVPGGVGPMTITMLLNNTLKLAENSLNSSFL